MNEKKLFLGRLPFKTSEADVKNIFNKRLKTFTVHLKTGKIVDTKIGFINYDDDVSPEALIREFNNTKLHGQNIEVKLYSTEKKALGISKPVAFVKAEVGNVSPVPEFRVGLRQQVLVTHYESVFHFYVQLMKEMGDLEKLTQTINKNQPQYSNVNVLGIGNVGMICVAKDTNTGIFCRVKIMRLPSVYKPEDVIVKFIDFGHTSTVHNKGLFFCPLEFISRPAFAHPCGLAVSAVCPMADVKIKEIFNQEVLGQAADMVFNNAPSPSFPADIWPVDLFKRGDSLKLNLYRRNLVLLEEARPVSTGPRGFTPRSTFSANPFHRPPAPSTLPPFQNDSGGFSTSSINSGDIPSQGVIDGEEDLCISYSTENGIAVQLVKDQNSLLGITDQLGSINQKSLTNVNDVVDTSLFYIARFSDGNLYRVKIKCPEGGQRCYSLAQLGFSATVHFVDYGNNETKDVENGTIKDCFFTPTELKTLTTIPPLATFYPFNWEDKSLLLMDYRGLVEDINELKEKIITGIFSGGQLKDIFVEGESWIQHLKRKGIVADSTESTSSQPNYAVVAPLSDGSNRLAPTSAITGTVYGGTLTYVKSATNVFVQTDDITAPEALFAWMESADTLEQIKSYEVGRMYGVKSKSVDTWARAIIMQMSDPELVKVHLVDFGQDEIINWKQLVPLPIFIEEIPPLAKEFVLDPKSWIVTNEFQLKSMLQDLLSERNVIVRVKPGATEQPLPFVDMSIYEDGFCVTGSSEDDSSKLVVHSLIDTIKGCLRSVPISILPVESSGISDTTPSPLQENVEFMKPEPSFDSLLTQVGLSRLLFCELDEANNCDSYILHQIIIPLIVSPAEPITNIHSEWKELKQNQQKLIKLSDTLKNRVHTSAINTEEELNSLVEERNAVAEKLMEIITNIQLAPVVSDEVSSYQEKLKTAASLVDRLKSLYSEDLPEVSLDEDMDIEDAIERLMESEESLIIREAQKKSSICAKDLQRCLSQWLKAMKDMSDIYSLPLSDQLCVNREVDEDIEIYRSSLKEKLSQEVELHFNQQIFKLRCFEILNCLHKKLISLCHEINEHYSYLQSTEVCYDDASQLVNEDVLLLVADIAQNIRTTRKMYSKARALFLHHQADLLAEDPDSENAVELTKGMALASSEMDSNLINEWSSVRRLFKYCQSRPEFIYIYRNIIPCHAQVALEYDENVLEIQFLEGDVTVTTFHDTKSFVAQINNYNLSAESLAAWHNRYEELCAKHEILLPLQVVLQNKRELKAAAGKRVKIAPIYLIYGASDVDPSLAVKESDPPLCMVEFLRPIRSLLYDLFSSGFVQKLPDFWLVKKDELIIKFSPPSLEELLPVEDLSIDSAVEHALSELISKLGWEFENFKALEAMETSPTESQEEICASENSYVP